MGSNVVADAVAGLGKALIDPVTELISEAIEDKDKAAQLAAQISTMAKRHAQDIALAQLEVSSKEATHTSWFVAGGRPFVVWVCASAMAFNYILAPLLGACGLQIEALDTSTMFPVLMGILGLGGLRTAEKVRGVARDA